MPNVFCIPLFLIGGSGVNVQVALPMPGFEGIGVQKQIFLYSLEDA
ncbi:MAG: hypothetical protein JSW01_05775 [Candidatus Bathyarchaeota archaeon]|nr:MAG: hypothetical protein JSW01_05775 [Candidatus Bathyarchaeota archaeon]